MLPFTPARSVCCRQALHRFKSLRVARAFQGPGRLVSATQSRRPPIWWIGKSWALPLQMQTVSWNSETQMPEISALDSIAQSLPLALDSLISASGFSRAPLVQLASTPQPCHIQAGHYANAPGTVRRRDVRVQPGQLRFGHPEV